MRIKEGDIKKDEIYNVICIKAPDSLMDEVFGKEKQYILLRIYQLKTNDFEEDLAEYPYEEDLAEYPYCVAFEKDKFTYYLFTLDEINVCFRRINI